ncbi:hypothetical protein [Nocardia brasiliensis]|uniref:hypothetical protein n=1 Tax=Nocardia brasiliensis TaxID=37326 RepID=UPI003D941134
MVPTTQPATKRRRQLPPLQRRAPLPLTDDPGHPLTIYRCLYACPDGTRHRTIEIVQALAGHPGSCKGFGVSATEARRLAHAITALTAAPGPDRPISLASTQDTPLNIRRQKVYSFDWDFTIEVHQGSEYIALTPAEAPKLALQLQLLADTL